MTGLANRTALVTGASRGIGRAIALALATAGARVVIHYGHSADKAKAVVDQIRAAGGRADAVAVNLADAQGAHALAARVRDLVGERLDIIVGFRPPIRAQRSRALFPCAAASPHSRQWQQHSVRLVARGSRYYGFK
jgi:NAD(P)-dependent dehydrogenase (short-subunit alcohol dehydrogenase family)